MSLLKRENGIGIKKGSTWGTAVEPETDDGLIVKSHSPGVNEREVFINDNEFDHDMPTIQTLGVYPEVKGSLVMPFYYEGTEQILASIFGIYNGVLATDIVTHTFKFNPVLSGIFHTIAWDEGSQVKSVKSAVFESAKISVDDGLSLETGYIGDQIAVESGFTTPLGLTYKSPGIGKFGLLQTVVSLNNYDGADFAPSDELSVNNLEVNIQRGFVSQPHCAGALYIEEPKEINVPVIGVTMNFPKKDAVNTNYFGDFAAGSLKKMKVVITGALIDGVTNYTFTMNFPLLRIKSAPVYDQESPIPTTLELEVLKAATAPNGMTEIVPYASLVNKIPVLTGYPSA